jgi:hypothetical protein
MVLLPLRYFGLLNQINGPSSPSSINDRDLLRVFRPFPPLFSSEVLDLVSSVHLYIDGSRRFIFPDFRNIKSQFSLPSKYVDFYRVSTSIGRLKLTSGLYPKSMYSCHLSSRSKGSYLLQTSRRSMFTSGLYPESTDSRHLSSGYNSLDLLQTIQRLMFTSGIYPKSTDSCHLSSRFDSSDLLWTIRRSTFTSCLYLKYTDSCYLSYGSDGPDLFGSSVL